MKLNYLLSDINNQVLSISCSKSHLLVTDIKGLSLNSKEVKNGYLFFCLSGTHHKGSDFIKEANLNGAKAIISEEKLTNLPKDLIFIQVRDVVECLGTIANKFYNDPSDKLDMTAITGTNGKTTITYILENILKNSKKSAGVIGTVNYRFSGNVINAKNTTPDILTIHNLIDKMLRDKIKYLVMEVSSHALDQRRIEGLKFNQAIFTNLTQDHLDYHKTKLNYFKAKSKLFFNYLKKDRMSIINADDIYGRKLLGLIKETKKYKILTYGIKNKADVSANNISFRYNGSQFSVKTPKYKFNLETNLIGLFNIYNALASISASLAMNIPKKHIIEGLKEVYVPGRAERVCFNHNINIFVDYAHTEDALRNILLSLKKLKGRGRLIVVFGCGGDRDKDKRHKMGRLASELADFVIITSDNPRSEEPQDIISDIKSGISKTNYLTIVDRKEAIKKAIDIAHPGDIIVVAGKGHEDYQIIKNKKFAFNDHIAIQDLLSKKGFSGCLN